MADTGDNREGLDEQNISHSDLDEEDILIQLGEQTETEEEEGLDVLALLGTIPSSTSDEADKAESMTQEGATHPEGENPKQSKGKNDSRPNEPRNLNLEAGVTLPSGIKLRNKQTTDYQALHKKGTTSSPEPMESKLIKRKNSGRGNSKKKTPPRPEKTPVPDQEEASSGQTKNNQIKENTNREIEKILQEWDDIQEPKTNAKGQKGNKAENTAEQVTRKAENPAEQENNIAENPAEQGNDEAENTADNKAESTAENKEKKAESAAEKDCKKAEDPADQKEGALKKANDTISHLIAL